MHISITYTMDITLFKRMLDNLYSFDSNVHTLIYIDYIRIYSILCEKASFLLL